MIWSDEDDDDAKTDADKDDDDENKDNNSNKWRWSRPLMREDSSSIPGDITSLFQLLSFLCSFNKL